MFARILIGSFIVSFAFAENYFEKHPIFDARCSTFIGKLRFDISYHYFEDQHDVAFIELMDEPAANMLRCMESDKMRPVEIFNDLKLFHRIARDTSGLTAFPLTEGVLIKAQIDDIKSHVLEIVSSCNPRSQVLILMPKPNVTEAKEIIAKAFYEHRMLNVACFLIDDKFVDGKFIGTTTQLIMFNPYLPDVDKHVTFDFTFENSQETYANMKKFKKERTRNLHGYPLRIAMFDYPMTSKAEYKHQKITHYSYVDGDTVSVLARVANFTPVFDKTSKDIYLFGSQLSNGTFTGALADVEYNQADLAGNPKLIANYNTENSVFLHPITMTRLSFIIRKRETKRVLMISPLSHFDIQSKVILVALAVLLPMFYVCISRSEQGIKKSRIDSFGKSLIYSFALLTNISMKQPKTVSTRVIVATFLFYTIIFSTLFQSTIVKNLNAKKELGKINTIKELADEGYKIKMPRYLSTIFRQKGLDKVSWMMNQTKQPYSDVGAVFTEISEVLLPGKKIALLWTDLYTTNFLDQYYDEDTCTNLFETVPEIAFEFYISLMAPKHSPFVERFNEILSNYVRTSIGTHHMDLAYNDNAKALI